MSGIASAIIIPPANSGPDRAAIGARGTEAFLRIAAVESIAPRREDAPHRRTGFNPEGNARGRGRDTREVRQLAIRPDYPSGANLRADRAPTNWPGTDHAGPREFAGAAFASIHFLAQVIGQEEESFGRPRAYHPDGAALGNDAYRRAGAAPPHYSEQPAVFRVAI